MSQDFAKKRTTKKKRPTATKKPAAKKSAPKNKRSKAATAPVGNRPPAVLWVAALVCTILLLLGLYFLAKYTPRPDKSYQDKTPTAETRFDFFTTFPEAKIDIDIPESDHKIVKYEYLLQAGSFKSRTDAESLKAELGFMGYQSQISEIDHNDTRWYRVQIGPLDSRSKVSAARSKLFENGVDTLVFKNEVSDE